MILRELATILVFLPGILSVSQNKEDTNEEQAECAEFEEAGFFCVPGDYCTESGIIKANFSEQFEPRWK
jgi:hypothetical protein